MCFLWQTSPCKTTLIICPQSILPQWREEIAKHTQPGALGVFHYHGVAKQYISPRELASHDIVLASYETLRSELYHATSQEFIQKLRHSKRFGSLPSPLTALQWWRVSAPSTVHPPVIRPPMEPLSVSCLEEGLISGVNLYLNRRVASF